MPRAPRDRDRAAVEESLKRSRRSDGLTKLRSRMDQAMDEMIRLHERNDIGGDLVAQLRALSHKVHQLELKARAGNP